MADAGNNRIMGLSVQDFYPSTNQFPKSDYFFQCVRVCLLASHYKARGMLKKVGTSGRETPVMTPCHWMGSDKMDALKLLFVTPLAKLLFNASDIRHNQT